MFSFYSTLNDVYFAVCIWVRPVVQSSSPAQWFYPPYSLICKYQGPHSPVKLPPFGNASCWPLTITEVTWFQKWAGLKVLFFIFNKGPKLLTQLSSAVSLCFPFNPVTTCWYTSLQDLCRAQELINEVINYINYFIYFLLPISNLGSNYGTLTLEFVCNFKQLYWNSELVCNSDMLYVIQSSYM